MCGVLGQEVVLQDSLDFVSMRKGFFVSGCVWQEGGTISPFGQGGNLAHGKSDPSIAGCIDAVGSTEISMCVATGCPSRRLPAIIQVGGQYLELKVENGLKEADFNGGALAGFTALQERGEDALHEMLARKDIRNRQTEGNRGLARITTKPCKPG